MFHNTNINLDIAKPIEVLKGCAIVSLFNIFTILSIFLICYLICLRPGMQLAEQSVNKWTDMLAGKDLCAQAKFEMEGGKKTSGSKEIKVDGEVKVSKQLNI